MDDAQAAIFRALADAQTTNEPVVLVTVIATQGSMPRHASSKMLVHQDGSTLGTIGGGALEARVIEEALVSLVDGQSRVRSYTLNSLEAGDAGICGGTAELFIDPINAASKLLVIGGGHVGKALCELARWAGYRVILSDDRTDYCNPSYVPDLAEYVVCSPSEISDRITIDTNTYVAAVTRGLPVDLKLIPALLQTPSPYIGFIGSRRRWALTVKALVEEVGLDSQVLARIHAPIGLELQAETPKEIAVSILAEITMVRRGGTGRPMHESY